MEQVTEDANRADNLSIADIDADADVDADADANKADNPGIDTEGATGSDGNGNRKTKCLKIVSFFINDITSHTTYNLNDETNEKLMRTQTIRSN